MRKAACPIYTFFPHVFTALPIKMMHRSLANLQMEMYPSTVPSAFIPRSSEYSDSEPSEYSDSEPYISDSEPYSCDSPFLSNQLREMGNFEEEEEDLFEEVDLSPYRSCVPSKDEIEAAAAAALQEVEDRERAAAALQEAEDRETFSALKRLVHSESITAFMSEHRPGPLPSTRTYARLLRGQES